MHQRKIKSRRNLMSKVYRRRGKYEDIKRYKKYISYKR